LLSFGESGLTIRVVARVKPGAQWAAERELRVRLKKAFDATGVEVPFPRQVVYLKNEDLKKS
jgi:small conductance mechanosensitive channel